MTGGELFTDITVVGVSEDGQVVVGFGLKDGTNEAFIWTFGRGFRGLGHLEGAATDSPGLSGSRAMDVSADGSVVTGFSGIPEHWSTWRWTEEGGMTAIEHLEGGSPSIRGRGISGDGNFIVGSGESESAAVEAFRHSEALGTVSLNLSQDGAFTSEAVDATTDGTFIIGYRAPSGTRDLGSFIWNDSNGMTSLGQLPGGNDLSSPTSISGNGVIVTGHAEVGEHDVAFVWKADSGMQRLDELLISDGADTLDGWNLVRATAISTNGRWVVGYGTNPEGDREGFLARLPSEYAEKFTINPGLNDAWYNPATSGQGFLINVFPQVGAVFLVWFTFDTELPPASTEAVVGDPGQRWLTALGAYDGTKATLDITLVRGGVFDNADHKVERIPDGTIELNFEDCTKGTVYYDIPSSGLSGEIEISRVVNDNVGLCEALQ